MATPMATTLQPSVRPRGILDLPIELFCQMLILLSAKEVQRARRVCRQIRAIIDEEKNVQAIVKPGETSKYASISEDIDWIVNKNGAQASLLDCVDRIVRHRGLMYNRLSFWHAAFAASFLWATQQHSVAILLHRNPEAHCTIVEAARQIAWLMLMVRTCQHVIPDLLADSEGEIRHLLNEGAAKASIKLKSCPLDILEQHGINSTILEDWVEKLLNHDWPQDTFKPLEPPFSLTAVFVGPLFVEQDSGLFWYSVDRSENIETCLGVPKFPELGNFPCPMYGVGRKWFKHSHVFAYAVRTKSALNRVEEALRGYRLKPLEKAAILEELFIY